jgi:hypothetical protein
MAHCLWNDDENTHRYHLTVWKHVAMKKEYGGVGVPGLRDLNLCLLGSWVKRYVGDRDKIWRMLVDFKYNTKKSNIFTCKDAGVSNF